MKIKEFSKKMEKYESIDEEKLRRNMVELIEDVKNVEDQMGVKLKLNKDDKKSQIFGLKSIE